MISNDGQNPRVVIFIQGQAAGVATDFAAGRFIRLGQIERLTFDRNYLPAAAQADFLRANGHARDAPMVKPSVALFPLSLRGENPAESAGVRLYRECRFGCLLSRRDNRRPTLV